MTLQEALEWVDAIHEDRLNAWHRYRAIGGQESMWTWATMQNDAAQRALAAEVRRLQAEKDSAAWADQFHDPWVRCANERTRLEGEVRRLQAEVEQKEDTILAITRQHGDLQEAIVGLRADLAAARQERDDYRATNESVAVCANHTENIVDAEGLANGCYVCEFAAARAREEAAAGDGYDEGYLDCATKKLRNREAFISRWREAHPAPPGSPTTTFSTE